MTGKKVLWASCYVLACTMLLPTVLSYAIGFQDYFQDWASARNWWEGIAVYSPHRLTVPRYLGVDYEHLGDGKPFEGVASVTINAHPPSAVLFYLPFALLPYGASFLAWNLVSIGCLVLGAWIIVRELELQVSPWLLVFLGTLNIAGGPLFEQMFFGQSNAVTALLLVLAWQAHRRGWQGWEGFHLGAAAAIKLYPLALLMIPFGTRRWRALGSAVATVLLFVGVSICLFGGKTWDDYLTLGMPEAVIWSDILTNASVFGFWKKLFVSQNRGIDAAPWVSPIGFWIGYVGSWAVVMGSTFTVSLLRDRSNRSDYGYAAGTCAMLLLSPTCWPHYFIMLFLPLALLWKECGDTIRGRRIVLACFTLLFMPPGLLALPTLWRGVGNTTVALTMLVGVPTFALVALWGHAVSLELCRIRASRELGKPKKVEIAANRAA